MIAFGAVPRLSRTRTPASTLPARDLGEIRLAEHLGRPGCPVCAARLFSEQRLIDAVIGEAVNDVGVRRRLERAGGYCRRHAGLLPIRERARGGGTLGSAILLGSVLEARLERLRALDGAGGRRLHGPLELRTAPSCPLCADIHASVAAVRTVLLSRLEDSGWAEALATAVLCLDDLMALWQVVARSDGRVRDAWHPVGAAQLGRLAGIVAAAQGYIAHSSHDRQSELTDEERAAADRIVSLLAGGEGSAGRA